MKKNREEKRSARRARAPALIVAALAIWAWGTLVAGGLPSPPATDFACRTDQDGRTWLHRGPDADGECPPGISFVIGRRFDLNAATAQDLDRLPGVGERSAAAITLFRKEKGPITDPAQIETISGLSPRAIDGVRRWTRAGKGESHAGR